MDINKKYTLNVIIKKNYDKFVAFKWKEVLPIQSVNRQSHMLVARHLSQLSMQWLVAMLLPRGVGVRHCIHLALLCSKVLETMLHLIRTIWPHLYMKSYNLCWTMWPHSTIRSQSLGYMKSYSLSVLGQYCSKNFCCEGLI